MQILFTLAVLSFVALAWAAGSMARHVRRSTSRRFSRGPAFSAVGSLPVPGMLASHSTRSTVQRRNRSGTPIKPANARELKEEAQNQAVPTSRPAAS